MVSKKQKIDENEKENIGQLNLQNDDDEEMEEEKSPSEYAREAV